MAVSVSASATIADEIRLFIIDSFLFGDLERMPADDQSLLEHEVLDSTDILELIVFIEQKFDIEVDDSEVVRQNFDSVERLARFVIDHK